MHRVKSGSITSADKSCTYNEREKMVSVTPDLLTSLLIRALSVTLSQAKIKREDEACRLSGGVKWGFKCALRAHTLSPHFVSLRFVSTLRPYALSKVKEELMGGFSSSSPVLPVLPCLPVLPVAGATYPLPCRITGGSRS